MVFLKMSLMLLGHELPLYSNWRWEWTVNEQWWFWLLSSISAKMVTIIMTLKEY